MVLPLEQHLIISPVTSEKLEFAGVELESEGFPFMNAAGSVNGPGEESLRRDFIDVARAPGVAVMLGSVTVPSVECNGQAGGTVYRHVKETGLTYNSVGLANIGIERTRQTLPDLVSIAREHGKEVGVSLAPLSSDPGTEWARMAEVVLGSKAIFVEFNAGCPNVYDAEGNPKAVLSLEPDALGEALEHVQSKLGTDIAAGVKLSPAPVENFGPDAIGQFDKSLPKRQAEVINELGMVKYVSYINTFGGHMPVGATGNKLSLSVPGGAGGVSGPGIAHIAHAQTEELLKHLDPRVGVVAAGGIDTGWELFDRVNSDPRIKLGSAVTALWRAPSLGEGATRLAREYALASQS